QGWDIHEGIKRCGPGLVTAIVLASVYTTKKKAAAQTLGKQTLGKQALGKQALGKQSLGKQASPIKQAALGQQVYLSEQQSSGEQEYVVNQGGTAVLSRSRKATVERVKIWPIVKESLQGSALSALLLGLALGILTRPESVYESFFDPLFRGLLSILMLVMGMEATARLGELRKVGQWYALYAFFAPLLHGFIAFGLGMIAHAITDFSFGGVVILAVIAASSSDISGPPTLRAGIPSANPSAYIGSSTAVGTPVALAIGIPLFIGLAQTLAGS
ncbi:MAG: sodium-dependent bicarbonate transport family permease, partial [Cyanobacteria bacterium J06606_4]